MKKFVKLLAMIIVIMALVVVSVPIVFSTQGDYIAIPDPNFAAAVRRRMGLPDDAPIPRNEVEEVTILSLRNQNIFSLTGIEYFTALEWLDAGNNNLTTLNVSNNHALIELAIFNNPITTLDISNNLLLEGLFVSGGLTELDVSNNAKLVSLVVSGNQLTELDVSNNPVLEHLDVSFNNLTSLDVSNNHMLGSGYLSGLRVYNNRMTTLDSVIGWRDNPHLVLGENFLFFPWHHFLAQKPSPWAESDIERAYELDLVHWLFITGFTQPTTRAEFAHLAVILYESATDREITGRTSFNDTADLNVLKAAYIGVVQGVGGGYFNPRGTLTREQAATMLSRLAYAIGVPLPEHEATFSDNDAISDWAIGAVGQVQAAGIMGGTGDNMFSPRGSYTREQSIVTILRLFDFVS